MLEPQKALAAQLIAEGEKTRAEVAAEVGICERQLYRWQHEKEFQAEVEKHLRAFTLALMPVSIKRLRTLIEKAEPRESLAAIALVFKLTGWLDRREDDATGEVKHVLLLPAKTADWRALAEGQGTVEPPEELGA